MSFHSQALTQRQGHTKTLLPILSERARMRLLLQLSREVLPWQEQTRFEPETGQSKMWLRKHVEELKFGVCPPLLLSTCWFIPNLMGITESYSLNGNNRFSSLSAPSSPCPDWLQRCLSRTILPFLQRLLIAWQRQSQSHLHVPSTSATRAHSSLPPSTDSTPSSWKKIKGNRQDGSS